MPIAGQPRQFFGDFWPDDFVSDLLDLVLLAWQRVEVFSIPTTERFEPRISALLKNQLLEELWQRDLPFTVHVEIQEHDAITGKQIARRDIDFLPRDTEAKGQKPYLSFESKRLRCPKANNDSYIAEMRNFIDDTKQVKPSLCGMLGYVMDGQDLTAYHSLQKSIKKKSAELNMMPDIGINPHQYLVHPPHGETDHDCPVRNGRLTIYHLLLAVAK